MYYRPALIASTLLGCTAVIIGAFGAHYLKTIFTSEQLLSFETGVRYQFYHSLALAFTGLLSFHFSSKHLKWATLCFILGTLFFSGSIYLLNLLKAKDFIGLKGLGILTPVGGVFLVVGWLCLLASIWKKS
jgi:uncharacterized membrane protein YgdD (TMEM256/DUF423 family)